MDSPTSSGLRDLLPALDALPLFPLSTVLFPGALLPLHIFEPRYRTMIRDVLDGHADRISLSGIDRWLGGVHVHGHGPTWRWSAPAGQLIES